MSVPPGWVPSAGSDLIVPNYLTIDPVTGLVGANFSGKVHASGLELDAFDAAASSSDSNIVRWLSPDGIERAAIGGAYSSIDATLSELIIGSKRDAFGVFNGPSMSFEDSDIASGSRKISLIPGNAHVPPGGTTQRLTLLDNLMQSDWAFKPSVTKLTSTGNTGALGGAFQDLPGLATGNIPMRVGQTAILSASVVLQWAAGTATAFWVVGGASGASNLTAQSGAIQAAGQVGVPVMSSFTATVAGNHTFKIQCQAGGGGGVGIGAAGVSHATVTVY